MKLLDGIIVLDFAQYLAGPWAATKLADLGARVIKIERPNGGDNSRRLTLCNLVVDGDSTVFHSMNRNKESYTVNMRDKDELEKVKKLIAKADVMIENFRPGIMEKIGIGYEDVKKINPGIIYASVTGYGATGPLVKKPGQDLIVQSMAGIPWLNGNHGENPMPMGLAVADMLTSMNIIEGILAAIIGKNKTGVGAHIEASLLESAIDLQFEPITTFFQNGNQLQDRSAVNNAHAYLPAPYGVYQTKDGYMCLAMGSITQLGELLECKKLCEYVDSDEWFTKRDEIKQILADHLVTAPTKKWLDVLEAADFWAGKVNNIEEVVNDPALSAEMFQDVVRKNGTVVKTTRTPLRINGEPVFSSKGAPVLGEDTDSINLEFDLI